jgi:phospholipid N-methyltransferase
LEARHPGEYRWHVPSITWLKTAFDYGFDSGNVESRLAGSRRRFQERKCGGSYREVFRQAVVPHLRPDSTVLELGPGKGSWSRALLPRIPEGRLFAADYVDVSWALRPEEDDGRLVFHQVADNTFSAFRDGQFDFFFSFGVLCHNPAAAILEILANALPKMRVGATAVHQYGDWEKLDAYGWERGEVPEAFKELPDEEIWWPRNSAAQMAELARAAGWTVVSEDLGLLGRDGLILLRRS